MVRIRFKRVGRPHAPYFRLVAIDKRQSRDAEPIEILGTFRPSDKKNPSVNIDRIRHWVSVGALPTDTVRQALKTAGVWDQVKPGSAAKTQA